VLQGDEAYESARLFNRIIENIEVRRALEVEAERAANMIRDSMEAEIAAVIEACGRGEFDHRVPIDGRSGSLLRMAEDVNRLCEAAAANLDEVLACLETVAAGDLDRCLESRFEGLLGPIRGRMNGTLDGLSDVVAAVRARVGAAARRDFAGRIELPRLSGHMRDLAGEVEAVFAP
jgi:hypothetical protein